MTSAEEKPIVWLHGEVKTPPFSREARLEAGYLLGRLQRSEPLSMPHSRPMPKIGRRCHELRIVDADQNFRIVYHLEADAVVILEVFSKKTRATPLEVIDACRRRIARYEQATGGRR
jgi:phage-related protein